jgi:hypothetical protein
MPCRTYLTEEKWQHIGIVLGTITVVVEQAFDLKTQNKGSVQVLFLTEFRSCRTGILNLLFLPSSFFSSSPPFLFPLSSFLLHFLPSSFTSFLLSFLPPSLPSFLPSSPSILPSSWTRSYCTECLLMNLLLLHYIYCRTRFYCNDISYWTRSYCAGISS